MKQAIIASALAVLLVSGALFLAKGTAVTETARRAARDAANANNVAMENGIQVIRISVNSGYAPSVSYAKAGAPTILRFVTENTYDCSSALSIPALGVRDVLIPTGSKDYLVTPRISGTIIAGSCQMGMYTFSVRFD